jgi:hypothetical protein
MVESCASVLSSDQRYVIAQVTNSRNECIGAVCKLPQGSESVLGIKTPAKCDGWVDIAFVGVVASLLRRSRFGNWKNCAVGS